MVASVSSKRARSPAPLVATRDRLAGGRHPAGRLRCGRPACLTPAPTSPPHRRPRPPSHTHRPPALDHTQQRRETETARCQRQPRRASPVCRSGPSRSPIPEAGPCRAPRRRPPGGADTTIVAPGDPHTMLRVDVTTGPATSDPITAAEPVIASVAREPGYRELGLTSGTLDGRPAEQWEFMVVESGVLLHKEDVFSFRAAAPAAPSSPPLRPTPTRACPNASRRCAGRLQHTDTDDAAHSRAPRGLPTIQPTQRLAARPPLHH